MASNSNSRYNRVGLSRLLRPRKGQGKPPTTSRVTSQSIDNESTSVSPPTNISNPQQPSPISIQSPSVSMMPDLVSSMPPPVSVNPTPSIFNSKEEARNSIDSSLPYIRNPYPTQVGTDPSQYYTESDGTIKYSGKYDENFLTFQQISISDITAITAVNVTFNFIVQFISSDTTSNYTSPKFKQELEKEKESNNPYRNKNTVATVVIDESFIKTYSTQNKFKIAEDYAEVAVSDTIKTKNQILQHIDWLCSRGETLRQASNMGAWSVETTDALGFDHASQLAELDGSEEFQSAQESEIPVNVTSPDNPIVETSEPVVEVETVVPTPPSPPAPRPTESTPPPYTLPNFGGIGFSGGGIGFGHSGGGKIICGELYRQGFLSEEVWDADQRFGRELFKTHPRIMLGYTFWAKNVVKYMRNNPHNTKKLYRIFKPWTEHMAYKMGVTEKDNTLGNITQKFGYIFSLIVYNYHQIKWGRFKFSYGK